MNNILKIIYDPDTQFCTLKHGYNKRFFDFVKFGVKPLSYRRYSPDKKNWEVHISRLPLVVAYGKKQFTHVDYSSLPTDLQMDLVSQLNNLSERTVAQWHAPTAYELLHLLPTAPIEVARAAYRALAFIHHPDRGGNSEVFREITEAFEEIEDHLCSKN